MIRSAVEQLMKYMMPNRLLVVIFAGVLCCTMRCMDDFNDDSQLNYSLFGRVLTKKKAVKNGTTMEKIAIYPQESHDSSQTIMRPGLLVTHPNARATVLVCHGFMCDQHDSGIFRSMFKRSHFNVMTFDFRAHGKDSQGQCCTFGHDEALDVIAAAKFIRNHPELGKLPVFAYGFSMGAVSAIEAQSMDDSLFDAMILDCPFESSEKVIKTGLNGLKFSILGYDLELPGRELLEKYAFHPYVQSLVKTVLRLVSQMDATQVRTHFYPIHTAESAKKITVPCFFIHCKNDEKVSVDQVKRVYLSAAGYKKLWLTNGRRHCDSAIYNPEGYAYKVREFYNHVMDGIIDHLPQEGIEEDPEDDYELLLM
jgi:pimeloyl-ACP methyl ester carboxylesterase